MDDLTYEILLKFNLPKVNLIKLSEFENEDLLKAKKNRTFGEYCWTSASSLMWFLLNKNRKLNHVAYLDADMYFYSDPETVFKELGKKSILIIPHRFDKKDRSKEKTVGKYNVSMVIVKNDRNGLKCLDWWRRECLNWCYHDGKNGFGGDQKYLDKFPKQCPSVVVCKNIGAGLAHWNIENYKIIKVDDTVFVNKKRLVFFHFQGMRVYCPFLFSSKIAQGIYTKNDYYKRILYNPYVDDLCRALKRIRELFPSFDFGFEKRRLNIVNVYILYVAWRRLRHVGIFLFWAVAGFFYKAVRSDKFLLKEVESINHVAEVEFFKILEIYLRWDECDKFSDCQLLYKLKKQQPPGSDRYIEYPWVIEQIKLKQGKLLDVGSTSTQMFRDVLPEGLEITGLDLNEGDVQGDIRKTSFANNYFDVVTCISTLEHVGVAGRYHSDNDKVGDIKAVKEMHRILKPGGQLLITVPYGVRDVLPINKLYNKRRFTRLFKGFKNVEIKYLQYNQSYGYWLPVSEEIAAKTDMLRDRWYALALIRCQK